MAEKMDISMKIVIYLLPCHQKKERDGRNVHEDIIFSIACWRNLNVWMLAEVK